MKVATQKQAEVSKLFSDKRVHSLEFHNGKRLKGQLEKQWTLHTFVACTAI